MAGGGGRKPRPGAWAGPPRGAGAGRRGGGAGRGRGGPGRHGGRPRRRGGPRRAPRGSSRRLQPPLLTSLEKGLRPRGRQHRVNEPQPPRRPESAGAARDPRAGERRGAAVRLVPPSRPFLSLLPAGPRARPARFLCPRPALLLLLRVPVLTSGSPTCHGLGAGREPRGAPALRFRRGARSPNALAARGRRAWGARCEPHRGGRRAGGGERWTGRTRGSKRGRGDRPGKRGKSDTGRTRLRKVGIDASVFCSRCCPRAGSRAGGKAVER